MVTEVTHCYSERPQVPLSAEHRQERQFPLVPMSLCDRVECVCNGGGGVVRAKKSEDMEAPCKAALCPIPGKFVSVCISQGYLWGRGTQILTTTTAGRNGVSSHQLPQGSGDGHKMAVGGIVLSGRETDEAQPHSHWPWGRMEAGEGARAW